VEVSKSLGLTGASLDISGVQGLTLVIWIFSWRR